MVNDVGLNDAVEHMAANEAEIAVNCSKGTLDEGPGVGLVVRQILVGVMQVGDSNCRGLSVMFN